MNDKGWIKTYRKIQECWIWLDKEPFDKRSAWIDLLLTANHSDKKILFNGELITVQRGQILTSIRKLSEKWKWSYDKCSRFLKLLIDDGMLQKESDNFRTLLTIVNYEVYQDYTSTVECTDEGASRTRTSEQAEHEQVTNKNVKNDKECKEDNNYCSEPKEDLASEPAVITLTLNDKSEYPIFQKDIDEWKELYPAVDVMQQLRHMKAWCDSNPAKRKTKRGVKRFITSWLMKEQDKGCRYITPKNNNSNSVLDKYFSGGKK